MEPEQKSNGAFIGLIIIIVILIIGGIYIFISNQKAIAPNVQTQLETVTNQDAAALNALEQDSATTDTSTGVDASTIK